MEAFGYPKTGARYDNDPRAVLHIPGSTPGVIRQYFQAAVMEYHPGDPDPVKLRLLDDDLHNRVYPEDTHLLYRSFGSVPPLEVNQIIDSERVLPPPVADPAATVAPPRQVESACVTDAIAPSSAASTSAYARRVLVRTRTHRRLTTTRTVGSIIRLIKSSLAVART